MKKLKMVTIGGGSSYTPELIEGLIKRHDELPIKELWLVDIEEGKEKLEIVGNFAKRMVKKAKVDIEIFLTLDRRKALLNADFVTTQFRVGQLDAREKDELIPLKYEVIGQETNGPGGLFKAFRTIPVIFDIINDCKELCPNAWIVSFTNPSGIIAEAVNKYTDWKRFIGLCNGPVGMSKTIEKAINPNNDHNLEIKMGGLNHMVFALDVRLDGNNVNDKLIEYATSEDNKEGLKNIVQLPWSKEFLKGFGYFGIDYLRYYFQKPEMLKHLKEDASKGKTRAQVVKEVEKELFIKYKDESLSVKPKELEARGGAYYSDAACNLISSIYNDKGDIQVVDVVNNGAITSLEDDVVVEVSCIINKDGATPIHIGELPPQICGIVQQLKQFELCAIKAAVTGDYNDALVAMTINPLVQSEHTGKLILDEMLEAHKKYLPQFNKTQ